MSNWFETIVPNDRTWMRDNIKITKAVKKGDATDLARYLSTVLEHTNDPALNGDNFTAVINIKNGFIPLMATTLDSRFRSRVLSRGEQVNKTVNGSSEPISTEYVWSVNKINVHC